MCVLKFLREGRYTANHLPTFSEKRAPSWEIARGARLSSQANRDARTNRRMPCPHGRRRSTCKECGGSGLCEHGRQRSACKECGGSSFCEHGRRRSICKDCGGGGLCEHGRQRSLCKDCGGGSICEHGRRRNTCKECRGSDHVIILEATEVELVFDDEEEEPGEELTTVQAHVVAGPRGGKRKR